MTFQESVRTCIGPKYFFKFGGRASRSEFWWFMLFIFLVNLCAGFIFSLFPPIWAASMSMVVSLLLFPANLGVTVRRLHDRNLSGWWLLLPISALALWFLGNGVAAESNTIGSALSLAMCIGYLAILSMPGQPGANKYGPAPAVSISED